MSKLIIEVEIPMETLNEFRMNFEQMIDEHNEAHSDLESTTYSLEEL